MILNKKSLELDPNLHNFGKNNSNYIINNNNNNDYDNDNHIISYNKNIKNNFA